MTISTLLTSKRSSDDIQTELFDLIGFERIELVQLLLEHRQWSYDHDKCVVTKKKALICRDEITKAYANSKEAVKREIASAAASEKKN